MLGVSRTTVANYETGNRTPEYDTLARLADIYQVSCDYIIRGISSEFAEIYSTTGLSEDAVLVLSILNKYEKDKMVPKPDQLSKIAAALNVSTMTLNGSEDPSFKVETIGDFMGFLFTMHHAGIMMLKGKRDKDGYIKEDTAYIEINPAIRQYFGVKGADNPNDLTVMLKNKQVLKDMIRWEQTENYLVSNKEKYDELSQKEKEVFDGIKADKEEIELRLSMSNVMLDTSAGISVRINNNYSV